MSNLMKTLVPRDRTMVGAEGSYMIDSEGNRLLDMYCDNGAAGLGYHHPIHQQAYGKLMMEGYSPHYMNTYRFDLREEAAAKLCEAAGLDKVFFCTSGAEAVEASIKLARKFQHDHDNGNRVEVWSVNHAFHGRTLGALAASDGPRYHTAGFGPLPNRFYHFDIDNIEEVSNKAAAVIVSPVFLNHDVIPYTHKQLSALRRYCDEHGIILIFDEVQSGAGRTGNLLYWQTVGVKPDIVAMAKGMAAGFPMGACLATEELAEGFTPGSHYSTFGGNVGSMVFLLETLKYMTPDFHRTVKEKAAATRDGLGSQPWVKDVRNAGMLFAVDTDFDGREFAKRCDEKGLIIGAFRQNPIRITPLLDCPMKDIVDAMEIMSEVARELAA